MRRLLPLLAVLAASPAFAQAPAKLKLLFLGDTAGHQPATRFKILQPAFAEKNIDLTYTEKLDDLNAKNLAGYDGLMIYANQTKITPEQEKALVDYVESGKGFIPVHCASYCFLNSPKYVELVGAQFRSHGTGTFKTDVVKPDHAIMKDFKSFSSWDETYVHAKHNEKDRTVLEVRTDGDLKEPWTWVRTPGKARIFYTAWGHDDRTWKHPGFQNLLERGVRWACGQDPALAGTYVDKPNAEIAFTKPKMTELRKDVAPFEYVPAKVPFYPPKRGPADPITKMQKPLSVEESMKHFVTPVDFEVKVFVTEEKLGGKPIAMTWDEQGRLWVSVTVDYPNDRQEPGKGHDKIVVCEDTNGDGVCDKVTTFAENLSIPTSILPYAGGLIVHQAPVTLFLKDTDGDGKADVRQELIRGWATNDTHAGPSNLHYGFDNWIYGSVGYAGFNGEVNGEKLNFRQGFYRFRLAATRSGALETTKLEFLRSTSNNTWGLAFNEAGELFGSTANGCPLVQMPIPNRYYEKVKGLNAGVLQNIAADNHIEPITDKVRQVDWHGGFTAASNLSIYTARTYPPEYWNRTAFLSEPTGHLTATLTLKPNGTTYAADYGWNLIASDDEWSSPIDAQVGPDGQMWVIDWYAYIVQHNPTPQGFKNGKGNAFETELRDKTHGRIYRVVYTKAKAEKPYTLKDATPEKLVETLKHHNMTWRLHAQRLLVSEAKPETVGALLNTLEDKSVDTTGNNPAVVHALHALQSLGALDGKNDAAAKAVVAAISHPSAAVRVAALGVLPNQSKWFALVPATVLRDPDPKVRSAALLAFSDVSADTRLGEMIALALQVSLNADANLKAALLVAANAHAFAFLSKVNPSSPEAQAVVERVAFNFAATDGKDVKSLLIQYADAKPNVLDPIVRGLAAGWPASRKPSQDEVKAMYEQLMLLLGHASPDSRTALLKLYRTWEVSGINEQLIAIAKASFAILADEKAKDDDRVAAVKQIIEFLPDSDDAAAKLIAAVTPSASSAITTAIFDALSLSKSKTVGTTIVAKLKDLPPTIRPVALRLVLARPEPTKAYLDAVEKGTLRFDMLGLEQKTALANHPDKEIATRAKKILSLGGGLPDANRQKVIDDYAAVLKKDGDAVLGKKLFIQHCSKCHKHGAEGQTIGPDLSGFAVHPKEEILIAVLDPSRSVEGNYKNYTAKLADGRVLTGLLAAQSKTTVEILDAENKRHTISTEDLDELKESKLSLMPEGFEKQIPLDDMANLLGFLALKGKYLPIPLDKVATVVTTKGMFFEESSTVERIVFKDWLPKEFKGVPFNLVDPRGDTTKNGILLYSTNGKTPPKMPKTVTLPCNTAAKAIHILGGVGGWSAQGPTPNGSVSMIVRLHYADGKSEDHELKDGVHIADYIGRFDVPKSTFAFAARGQQVRYLAIVPLRTEVIKTIEFVKGPDKTAPLVMAVTVEPQ